MADWGETESSMSGVSPITSGLYPSAPTVTATTDLSALRPGSLQPILANPVPAARRAALLQAFLARELGVGR